MRERPLWWVKWWANKAFGYWHLVGSPAREGSSTLCGDTIPGSYEKRIEWGKRFSAQDDPKGRECQECRRQATAGSSSS